MNLEDNIYWIIIKHNLYAGSNSIKGGLWLIVAITILQSYKISFSNNIILFFIIVVCVGEYLYYLKLSENAYKEKSL